MYGSTWTFETRSEWMQYGACRETNIDAIRAVQNEFFLDHGQSAKVAKAICATCPVIDECLDYALLNREKNGVWGGKTEYERRPMRRIEKGKPVPKICTHCGQRYMTDSAHRQACNRCLEASNG